MHNVLRGKGFEFMQITFVLQDEHCALPLCLPTSSFLNLIKKVQPPLLEICIL